MEVEDNSSCDELEYSVTRLVKGLASSRKGARQGFATVLTEVLSEFASLSPEGMLRLITKTLEVTGSSKAWVSTVCLKAKTFCLKSLGHNNEANKANYEPEDTAVEECMFL